MMREFARSSARANVEPYASISSFHCTGTECSTWRLPAAPISQHNFSALQDVIASANRRHPACRSAWPHLHLANPQSDPQKAQKNCSFPNTFEERRPVAGTLPSHASQNRLIHCIRALDTKRDFVLSYLIQTEEIKNGGLGTLVHLCNGDSHGADLSALRLG